MRWRLVDLAAPVDNRSVIIDFTLFSSFLIFSFPIQLSLLFWSRYYYIFLLLLLKKLNLYLSYIRIKNPPIENITRRRVRERENSSWICETTQRKKERKKASSSTESDPILRNQPTWGWGLGSAPAPPQFFLPSFSFVFLSFFHKYFTLTSHIHYY